MRRRLIYLSPVEWHGLRQRPQELCEAMGSDFDVTYVNPVATRDVTWRDFRRLPAFARGLTAPARAFDGSGPRVASLLHLPWGGAQGRAGDWLLRRQIRERLAPEPGYTLCVGVPSAAARLLLRETRPGFVVYDCMDLFPSFHRGAAAARMSAVEAEVLRRSDVVLASSEPLRRRLEAKHRNVIVSPNGVDLALFQSGAKDAAPPPDMADWDGPVLGFCGMIGDWLDFGLLETLARRFPDCRLVLVGPWSARGGRELLDLPNVRWLGEKPHGRVPAYCGRFSVGLIPFALSELSRNMNPIKLYEYLSLGLPVVSTAIPEALRHQPWVRAASTRDDFIVAVRESLGPQDEEARESRSRYASSFSWERAAGVIREALRPSFEGKGLAASGTMRDGRLAA